jgi:hypothetical protein
MTSVRATTALGRLLLAGVTLLVAFSSAGAAASSGAGKPEASAQAVGVTIAIPGRPLFQAVIAPVARSTSVPAFSYPSNGGVLVSGAANAAAAETTARGAVAVRASASVENVSFFDGEITVAAVGIEAEAHAGRTGASGSVSLASVSDLQALGHPLKARRATVGGWGVLTVAKRFPLSPRPGSGASYANSAAALDLTLIRDHDGLPAGSEIELAVVTAQAGHLPLPESAPPAPVSNGPLPGDRPQLLPAASGPLVGVPQAITPPLGAGSYVFPVFGTVRYRDTFGELAAGSDYLHGVTVFGQLGQPIVAVTDGVLYAVGWNRTDGNRLWLRDGSGDEFYYGHLSAFAAPTGDGTHVAAGEVIGFMGDTGTTIGGGAQLNFEVHPVSLLFLGSQGAVDPGPYLASWEKLRSIALGAGPAWAPSIHSTVPAPQPGAYLVSSADIATAGLASAALRRTLTTPPHG